MLLISIFAIVTLGFLGMSMSRLLSTSSSAIIYEVYGLHALNAARSGLEKQVLSVFSTQSSDASVCYAEGANLSDLSKRQITQYTGIEGMESCSSESLCTVVEVDGTNYFRFESQGICQLEGENIVVSRTLAIDGRDVQI